MTINKKWHQFVNIQTKEIDQINPDDSNSQRAKKPESVKKIDSSSDKQSNYEQNTPTLKPPQNCGHRPRPDLNIANILKPKKRLSVN